MQLIELFPITKKQRQTLQANYQTLQQEVDKVGKAYEKKSYKELLQCAEECVVVEIADDLKISCSAEAYHVQKDGTICLCIDADGLPTMFGIKPSYHFYKCPDGSVHYGV